MPELPEIENLTRTLRMTVLGKEIVDVRCRQPRALNLPLEVMVAKAKGKIQRIERRAKSAILYLPRGSLWLHLGLGGQMLYTLPGQESPEATTSLIFADGSSLNMARTFMGHVHFVLEEELPKRLGEFGIEPLSDEFTAARLQQIIAKKGRLAIKTVLVDQAVIAGLGNVYSDEALHAAGIHPARKAASLSEEEINHLHATIRAVLQESINLKGERGYVDLSGREGSYVPRIHGAQACGRCGGPAEWALFGGRKGYFCPRCQSL